MVQKWVRPIKNGVTEILHTFYSHIQLEALDWYEDEEVLIAFQDGSTTKWTFENSVTTNPKSGDILYGPMPCKPITQINKINDLKVRGFLRNEN